MGKYAHNNVMDYGLNYIKGNCTLICLCQDQPLTYEEAIQSTEQNGKKLGEISVLSEEFSISDAVGPGRKLVVPAKEGINISRNGTLNHIALVKENELIFVTNITNSQNVYNGNTVNIPSWEITIADPV